MDRTWTDTQAAGQAKKIKDPFKSEEPRRYWVQLQELKIQKKRCLHLLDSLNPDSFKVYK